MLKAVFFFFKELLAFYTVRAFQLVHKNVTSSLAVANHMVDSFVLLCDCLLTVYKGECPSVYFVSNTILWSINQKHKLLTVSWQSVLWAKLCVPAHNRAAATSQKSKRYQVNGDDRLTKCTNTDKRLWNYLYCWWIKINHHWHFFNSQATWLMAPSRVQSFFFIWLISHFIVRYI